MITLDIELQSLKENLIELQEEATSQLAKLKKAIQKTDVSLAKEIIDGEKRVNALELMIDKECESILALNHPVATDLRFVLAALKISNDLERVGDNVKQIAKILIADKGLFSKKLMEHFKLQNMLEISLEMLSKMTGALREADTKMARKILNKDDHLDEIDKQSMETACKLINDSPKNAKEILTMLTIVKKIERIGDLTKNVGEELIFHIEAKVVKHKKDKKK